MNRTYKLVVSAMLLALGILLPFLTGGNRELGTLLSLMHIPVLLCGFLCGWSYGLLVGFLAPVIRSVLFGMPPMPFVAIPMAFELATYGVVAGVVYRILSKRVQSKQNVAIFTALIVAMVIGRVVNVIAASFYGSAISVLAIKNVFVGTLPGIILQIILIPTILLTLKKTGLITDAKN